LPKQWAYAENIFDGYVDVNWDGQNLYAATCSGQYDFIANRNELMDLIEDLKQIPADHLKSFI
jgi:hypothetical protein